jgi:hypothetical protein
MAADDAGGYRFYSYGDSSLLLPERRGWQWREGENSPGGTARLFPLSYSLAHRICSHPASRHGDGRSPSASRD